MISHRTHLDHVGLEAIDIITLEELEEASKVPGSIESVLELPDRAEEKIAIGGEAKEIRTSEVVDSIKWIAAARKSQIRKIPMD